jgi:hypothetical protein
MVIKRAQKNDGEFEDKFASLPNSFSHIFISLKHIILMIMLIVFAYQIGTVYQ